MIAMIENTSSVRLNLTGWGEPN